MKEIFPNINPTVKGISLAFLATLGMANVYVFSKAALQVVHYFRFQFYWFAFAAMIIRRESFSISGTATLNMALGSRDPF